MTFAKSKLKTDRSVASWPFKEARFIIEALIKENKTPQEIILQTGYGPSGLPHLGTFGEVLRTTFIKLALIQLTHLPVKIITFSDDLDGLRKVPENVPKQDLLSQYLHVALSSIPDPYDKYESFADHNNHKLRSFLDQYNFVYEFHSAAKDYKAGVFNHVLKHIMKKYDTVRQIVLDTVRAERQKNYSPFMPICPETHKVLQAKVMDHDSVKYTITYEHPFTKKTHTTSILNGHCKLQWKVDWAMRWIALGVNYEMFGKDLVDSVTTSRKICRVLGQTPPQAMTYELFLDKDNLKISKSKGNGLTFEEWLRYGNLASLALYLYQSPTKAKKIDVSVIPRVVDQYIEYLNQYNTMRHVVQTENKLMENPVWFIHNTNPPQESIPLNYSILINIAKVSQAKHVDFMWKYIHRYNADLTPTKNPIIHELAQKAIHYYQECLPKSDQALSICLNDQERLALTDLRDCLTDLLSEKSKTQHITYASRMESKIYEIGKKHRFTPLNRWFSLIYQVLINQSHGPRLCPLIIMLGSKQAINMLNKILQ